MRCDASLLLARPPTPASQGPRVAPRSSWRPCVMQVTLELKTASPGQGGGCIPDTHLTSARRQHSVFRAFPPVTPVTVLPQGLGTWILPQNWGGDGEPIFKKNCSKLGIFFKKKKKTKKKEIYSVRHLFMIEYIFLHFPVTFGTEPSRVLCCPS